MPLKLSLDDIDKKYSSTAGTVSPLPVNRNSRARTLSPSTGIRAVRTRKDCVCRFSSVGAVRALDGIHGVDGAGAEAQAALLTCGLVDSSRDPDVPSGVGGAGTSQETGAVEGEVVVFVHGPTFHLEFAAQTSLALVVVLQNALTYTVLSD